MNRRPPVSCWGYVIATNLLDRCHPDNRALIEAAYRDAEPSPAWDSTDDDTTYHLLDLAGRPVDRWLYAEGLAA